MSAFVVSDKHIVSLLQFAAKGDRRYIWLHDETGAASIVKDTRDVVHAEELANILKAENIRSVCYRYPDDTPEQYAGQIKIAPFQFTRGQAISPVQALKACTCYDYQTCETPDYKDTEAYRIIETIRGMAIAALPGYDAAAWEII